MAQKPASGLTEEKVVAQPRFEGRTDLRIAGLAVKENTLQRKRQYGGASPTAGKPWMTPSSIVTSSQDMRMTNRPNQPRSRWPVAA